MGSRTRANGIGSLFSVGLDETNGSMAQVSGEWQQALCNSLNAGGNLKLNAGRDITLQGSQANAGGHLGVQAGGDVNLLAQTSTNSTRLNASSRTSTVSNSREEDRLLLSTPERRSGRDPDGGQ